MVTDVILAGLDAVGVGPPIFEMADVEIVTPLSVSFDHDGRSSKGLRGMRICFDCIGVRREEGERRDGEEKGRDIQRRHIFVVKTSVQPELLQEHILPSTSIDQFS